MTGTARIGLALWGLLAAAGCGRETVRGQLMVTLVSDMPIPKDVTEFSVEIRQGAATRFLNTFPLKSKTGKTAVRLPASLAVVVGENPEATVNLKVAAWQGDQEILRLVREVTTTVPRDRVAWLPIELQWLCDGKVQTGGVEFKGREDPDKHRKIRSDCPEGETCIDGACVSDAVDSSKLPDWDPVRALGDPGAAGACFDVPACYTTRHQVFFDKASCTIDRPEGGKGANVAAVLDAATGVGFCDGKGCMIPLDGFSERGWTDSGARLQLNPAICKHPNVEGVAVTVACATKTRSLAPCPVGGSD